MSCILFLSEYGIFGLVVYLHYNNQVGGSALRCYLKEAMLCESRVSCGSFELRKEL